MLLVPAIPCAARRWALLLAAGAGASVMAPRAIAAQSGGGLGASITILEPVRAATVHASAFRSSPGNGVSVEMGSPAVGPTSQLVMVQLASADSSQAPAPRVSMHTATGERVLSASQGTPAGIDGVAPASGSDEGSRMAYRIRPALAATPGAVLQVRLRFLVVSGT